MTQFCIDGDECSHLMLSRDVVAVLVLSLMPTGFPLYSTQLVRREGGAEGGVLQAVDAANGESGLEKKRRMSMENGKHRKAGQA